MLDKGYFHRNTNHLGMGNLVLNLVLFHCYRLYNLGKMYIQNILCDMIYMLGHFQLNRILWHNYNLVLLLC